MNECKPGLPTDRTNWSQLQPLVATALKNFITAEQTKKLLRMKAAETGLAADLKSFIEKELAAKYGLIWNVNTDHNRVLEKGKPEKQPTDYLLEAIEHFRELRDGESSPFNTYLQQFAVNKRERNKDDFRLAYAYINDKSQKIARDEIHKNITKPDLIIHELGCLTKIQHNLIVFEIKPYWTQHHYYKLVDLARLKAFTQTKIPQDQHITPTYQHGIFLYLSAGGIEYGWRFQNGIDVPVQFKLDD